MLVTICFAVLEWCAVVLGPNVPDGPWRRLWLPAPAGVDALIGATAAVGGVLLALHFTTVGVIVSQSYSAVPAQLRALFLGERRSAWYVRLLALTVGVSVLVLAADMVGWHVHVLTVAAVTLLTVVAVVLLVVLGGRMFVYVEPTALAGNLPRLWHAALQRGIPRRRERKARWTGQRLERLLDGRGPADGEPTRDEEAHRAIWAVLDTYREIVAVRIATDDKDLRPLRRLGLDLVDRWIDYANVSTSFPTCSRVFARRYVHPNLLVADDTARSMATGTRTGVQPSEGPDPLWVERELSDRLDEVLARLLVDPDWHAALAVIERLRELIAMLAGAGRTEESLLLWQHVSGRVGRALVEEPSAGVRIRTEHERLVYRLAAADELTTALTQVWLQTIRYAEAHTPQTWRMIVSQTLPVAGASARNTRLQWQRLRRRRGWQDLRSAVSQARRARRLGIYGLGLPRPLLADVEQLVTRLEVEHFAEGTAVTPAWWVEDAMGRAVTQRLTAAARQVLDVLLPFYGSGTTSWHTTDPKLAVQVALSGLEALHKVGFHLPLLQEALDRVEGLRHEAVAGSWPAGLPDSAAGEATALERSLEVQLAKQLAAMPASPHDDALPDLFGRALDTVFDATLNAVLVGDSARVTELFPAVFTASLRAHDRLIADSRTWTLQSQAIAQTDPLLDLMALSGYARLFDSLHATGSWTEVTALWEALLDREDLGAKLVPRLIGALHLREGIFAVTSGDFRRTRMQQQAGARMRELGIASRGYWWDDTEAEGGAAATRDPVVSLAAREMIGADHGEHIFVAEYLRHRPEAPTAGLPHAVQAMVDQLLRMAEEHDVDVPDESGGEPS